MIIEKEFRFEAAHSLTHMPDGHPCKRPHGHSYRFVVQCTAPLDQETAFVGGIDYSMLNNCVCTLVIHILDHRDINEFIPISTAENLAIWIWDQIHHIFPTLSEVAVYETPTTCVRYRGEK